jgi:hypothetical protein
MLYVYTPIDLMICCLRTALPSQDGLLSYSMRELANIPDDNPKWILLDGACLAACVLLLLLLRPLQASC